MIFDDRCLSFRPPHASLHWHWGAFIAGTSSCCARLVKRVTGRVTRNLRGAEASGWFVDRLMDLWWVDGGRVGGRADGWTDGRIKHSLAQRPVYWCLCRQSQTVTSGSSDVTLQNQCKSFAVLIAGFHRGVNQANAPMGCYAGSVVLFTDVSGESWRRTQYVVPKRR